ncbi:MAG: hypothetical protein LBT74_06195 [Acidobacteriota bacterium]|nr:hypothetical protein [Acidobacteriota bacterium]
MKETISRREFMEKTVASTLVGAGAVKSLVGDDNINPPTNLRLKKDKKTLSIDDFVFEGWFRLPYIQPYPGYDLDFMFSTGALATRVVGGKRHFFMTSHIYKQACVEFADPEIYSKTMDATTPQSNLIRLWGDIYHKQHLVQNDGGERLETPSVYGYFWDGGKLWWQTARSYNAGSAFNDPCLGCSILNDDGTSVAYGQWRIAPYGTFRYCNFITEIPKDFAKNYLKGQTHGIGANNEHSGYQSTPYGPNLNAFAFPSIKTPPDIYNIDKYTGTASINALPLVGYDIDHRLNVPARRYRRDTKACVVYPLPGVGSEEIASYWAEQLDETGTCTWIDLPDKQGVVWFGLLVDVKPGYKAPGDPDGLPHYGYDSPIGGSEGRPAGHCCHGQDDPYWESNGPFAHSRVPWVFIMDPSQFVPIINGKQKPWDAKPHSLFRLNKIIELSSHPSGRMPRRLFGGSVFDEERRLLFISVGWMDPTTTYYPRPAIMVFRIKE